MMAAAAAASSPAGTFGARGGGIGSCRSRRGFSQDSSGTTTATCPSSIGGRVIVRIQWQYRNEAIVQMNGNAPPARINGGKRSSLGLTSEYRRAIISQRSVAVRDDLVRTVRGKAGGIIGGSVIANDTKLFAIGGEEDVVGFGARLTEGNEIGKSTVDGEGKKEGKWRCPRR